MEINKLQWALAAGLCVGGPATVAAPDYAAVALSEGVRATPALDVEARYDDNIFQTDDDEEDSVVTVVSPAIALEAGDAIDGASLTYAGDYGYYESSSDDNYADHDFLAEGHVGGGMGQLSGYVGYTMGHDDRGTGPSNGLGSISISVFDEPTEFETLSWGAEVGLGGGRRTNIVLGYDGLDTEYQNFRQITRARDRQSDAFRVRVAYDLTGKTDAIIEASNKQVEYDFTPAGQPELDSDETRISGGVEWEATAKTTGRVTLGWKDKDFDSSGRDDESGLTWDASVTWQPRTYSTFTLGTSNGFRETDNEGDVIETSSYNARWQYAVNNRLTWNTGLTFTTEEYEGAGSGREDDFFAFNLAADYDWRRWMTLGAGVNVTSRDSNVSRADFDRNQVFIRAQISL